MSVNATSLVMFTIRIVECKFFGRRIVRVEMEFNEVGKKAIYA
jgi:hypothetical protein